MRAVPHGGAPIGRCRSGASWSQRSTATGRRPARRWAKRSRQRPRPKGSNSPAPTSSAPPANSIRALMLIRAYRVRGHLAADLDPLELQPPGKEEELEPATYGFGGRSRPADLHRRRAGARNRARSARCSPFCGAPIAGRSASSSCTSPIRAQKGWIQERIEGPDKEISFTREGKRAILNKLIEAEGFEKFCNVKFTGTKRFGLDGGESMIPALEQIIKRGGALGVKEIVLGMPHRGRLNVLAQRDGQAVPRDLPRIPGRLRRRRTRSRLGRREVSSRRLVGPRVRRQQGASVADRQPVASRNRRSGRARQGARQAGAARRRRDRRSHHACMPLLLHGDAAFAGQGVVAECFGLSVCAATAPAARCISSSTIRSASPPSRAIRARRPIRPTSRRWSRRRSSTSTATIRKRSCSPPRSRPNSARSSSKDVVIDMFCYRRFGHNEGDEPAFTQPLDVQEDRRASDDARDLRREARRRRRGHGRRSRADEGGFAQPASTPNSKPAQSYRANKADWLDGAWSGFGRRRRRRPRAARPAIELAELQADRRQRITAMPDGFQRAPHGAARPRATAARRSNGGQSIDWATAEALAFGSLLDEGHRVRLSGQDSGRGTFWQRHSVLDRSGDEERYIPLNNVGPKARRATKSSIRCSPKTRCSASNTATRSPSRNALTLWEAQFGDFANGAQVIIDQFISSGERKWLRMSGLVMLLPHGYEGQGPEHSSARLERFLQLCAEDNMQVANCTTPANYFHILRRQMQRDFRKPLILMTPKSLLRHKRAVSRLDEMGPDTSFHRVLWDDAQTLPDSTDQARSRTTRSAASSCARARSITISSRSARSAASTTSICCASSSSIRFRRSR